MKSILSKKKNSMNVKIYGNFIGVAAIHGTAIAMLANDYIPLYVQPLGIKATCHLHKEPQGFKSIEELQQHELKEHRVWKG